MNRRTVLICWALLFAGQCATAQTNSPDLSAGLTNATVQADNSIELDFVLVNESKEPITLAERWNSWGAYHWRIQVVDAKGVTYDLKNPQSSWHRNFLTTFTIPPTGKNVLQCRLDLNTSKHSDAATAIFTLGDEGSATANLHSPHPNDWVFPLKINGIFAAEEKFAKGREGASWRGSVTTQPLFVRRTTDTSNASGGQ